MGILSNILTPSFGSDKPLTVRRIGLADEAACIKPVRRLLINAATGGLRLDHFFGAQRPDGRIVAGLLAVPRPGRTATIFLSCPRNEREIQALTHLADQFTQLLPRQSIVLVQAILQPHETTETRALTDAGFWKLGELAYLQALPVKVTQAPEVPPGVAIQSWRDELEPAFLQTLCKTYEQSQDCPALHNLRDPRDVLAGHRGTGHFDPSLWFLAEVDGQPAGVLLLNRIAEMGCMDLVYLGMDAAHRRRGVGRFLVRQALWQCTQRGVGRLTLAVDLRNMPALRLYEQFQFTETSRRTILMRRLSDDHAAPNRDADNLSTGFPS